MTMLRPNTNTRSQSLPMDDELEAVITILYVDDGAGGWVPFTGGAAGSGGLTNAELRAVAVPVSLAQLPGTLDADGGLKVHIQGGVSGLTDAQLRATPVPVTLPPGGAGLTDTELRATPVPISGTVATGLSQPLTDTQLRTTPVPISGTVSTGLSQGLTDTQLRATPVPIILDAAALAALETTELGATTLAALETIQVGSLPAIPAGTNNIGDVDVLSLPSIPAGNNNIGDVDVASLPAENRPDTSTLASVAASITSVTLRAAAATRRGLYIFNDSTSILYVALAATASAAAFTVKMQGGSYYELPSPCYTGLVTGIWVTATGSARVTELT